MMKKTRRIIIHALAFALIFCVSVFVMLSFGNKEVSATKFCVDLFDTKGVIFAESRLSDEKSLYKDGRRGLNAFLEENAEIKIRELSGEFTFDFMPENGINALTFSFKDLSDDNNGFDLIIRFYPTNVTGSVLLGGIESGIYYDPNYGAVKATSQYNASNTYTEVSNDYGAVKISYNPLSNSVKLNDAKIWDLSLNVNDGKYIDRTLKPMKKYSVSISASLSEQRGSLMLYGFNEKSLDKVIITESPTPRIFADFSYPAVKGYEYKLPEGFVFDVKDGIISSENVSVEFLYGPENVSVVSGAFVPESVGDYVFSYSVTNSSGKTASENFVLSVIEKMEGEFDFGAKLPDERTGQYTFWELPCVSYSFNETGINNVPVGIELFLNGEQIAKEDELSDGFSYIFNKTGDVKMIFTPVHEYYRNDKFVYEFSVDDSIEGYKLSSAIKPHYNLNDSFDIPSIVMITENGNLKSDGILVYPDGSQYLGGKVCLSQPGEYKIRYDCESVGKKYNKIFTFFTGTSPAKGFTACGEASVKEGVYSWNHEYSGVVAESREGGYVKYNGVIDFNTYDYENDRDSALLFDVIPDPYKTFFADYTYLYMTLTDVEDENNKVSFSICSPNQSSNEARAVMLVKVNDMPWTGIEGSRINFGRAGTYLNCSLSATPFPAGGVLTGARVYFDYKNLRIYTVENERFKLVADMRNKKQFSEGWSGFKSGKAYLSFCINDYINAEGRFVILNVDGQSLGGGKTKDVTAPEINVSAPNVIFNGVAGRKYPIFPAYANDDTDGYANVNKYVYYSNGISDALVAVNEDYFVPKYPGKYVIKYEASDGSGNTAQKYLSFTVNNEKYYENKPISVKISEDCVGEAFAGDLVKIPYVAEAFGGIGSVEITTELITPSGEIISGPELEFVAEEIGKYTVVYKATDALGETKKIQHEITVKIPEKPIFVSDGIVPSFLVVGNTYKFGVAGFVDYSSGNGKRNEAKVSVVGEKILVADKDGYIKMENIGETVTVRYTDEKTGAIKEYEGVKVINPYKNVMDSETNEVIEVLDVTKYFYSETASVIADESAVEITPNKVGSGVTFVNPVLLSKFSLKLGGVFKTLADGKRKCTLKSFSLNVRDYEESSDTVNIRFYNKNATPEIVNDSGISVSFNGKSRTDCFGSLYGESSISVIFNNGDGTFRDGNDNLLGFLPENKFASGRVIFSLTFDEFFVDEECGIRVEKINNQFVNSTITEDNGRPELYYKRTIAHLYSVGDKVTVPQVIGADVFGGVIATVTVKNSSGSIVTSERGEKINNLIMNEEITFVIKESVNYQIVITLTDDSGKKSTQPVAVFVQDNEPPVITVDGQVPQDVALYSEILLPQADASDNNDKKLTVMIVAVAEDNTSRMLKDNIFKPLKKGKYRIKYFVFDSSFNYAEVVFEVTVK